VKPWFNGADPFVNGLARVRLNTRFSYENFGYINRYSSGGNEKLQIIYPAKFP
jgi:hypothetical protein